MSQVEVGPNAKYFDDLSVGEVFVTQGRTVTKIDGLLWAMFTGDMNPMHVDEEYAKKVGIYGGIFAPGLAVVAIASGLNERLGLFAGTGLAMIDQSIRYKTPVLPGDTIRVRLEVTELAQHLHRHAGTVRVSYIITKETDVACIEGEFRIFLARRPH